MFYLIKKALHLACRAILRIKKNEYTWMCMYLRTVNIQKKNGNLSQSCRP